MGSGSNSSPSPPNGRITVTVASSAGSPPPPPPPNNNSNPAVGFSQQPKTNGGGGREDCWSEAATAVLIEAWGEHYLELSRGNLKQKHWKEVAEIVSSREGYGKTAKTDIQCKNRIDTVKKKYKSEKAKIAAGGGPSKWPFFDRLDQLIGPSAKVPVGGSNTGGTTATALSSKVPIGIPVGLRSGLKPHQYQKVQAKNASQLGKSQIPKVQSRKRGQVETETESDDDEEDEEVSDDDDDDDDDADGFPPEKMARVVMQQRDGKDRRGWGSSIRMLTQAILKFGEAYEQAENAKLQQVVEMEKTRMKFAKELELQRMQFFMKTQMEISQLKQGRRGGSTTNHHSGNNVVIKNNNSDTDN